MPPHKPKISNLKMKEAPTIYYNCRITTCDDRHPQATAMYVKDGRFVELGSYDDLIKSYPLAALVDLKGGYVYPGFYDAHCHMLRYAEWKSHCDLSGAESVASLLEKLQSYHAANKEVQAIRGYAWDEGNWIEKRYPHKRELDAISTDKPILLTRVDLHSAIVNQAALNLAGFTKDSQIEGGVIGIDEDGQLNGLVVDAAMYAIIDKLPDLTKDQKRRSIMEAERDLLAVGLTSIGEAWISLEEVMMIKEMQEKDSFSLNLYAMIIPDEAAKKYFFEHGPLLEDKLTARCFKYFADGALGSKGAWLSAPYEGSIDVFGLQFHQDDFLLAEAKDLYEHGFQMATHAIGDAANTQILRVYGEVLGEGNGKRWRIEHCQILQEEDVPKFAAYNITPSIQATHCTSDMRWVERLIGKDRLKYAYAWKTLLQQNGFVAAGSDFPVESIDPLKGFYAAVSRKDEQGFPENGFQIADALTREEALKAMTIWAAYANFEAHLRGSISSGKQADFVVLGKDILTIAEADILKAKVQQTYIGGKLMYHKRK